MGRPKKDVNPDRILQKLLRRINEMLDLKEISNAYDVLRAIDVVGRLCARVYPIPPTPKLEEMSDKDLAKEVKRLEKVS